RLPTDTEWAYAAGERFAETASDSALGDPGQRALARYETESSRDGDVEKVAQPLGTFGINHNGLADVAGNVWEWTDSCFVRSRLDEAGRPSDATTINCGVRVVEGRHRTYMTDFIRDARAGGCTAGLPPSNLGFRLVRDDGTETLLQRLMARIRNSFGQVGS
ncbi:MAG TPA: SUMF1/EgtB/PvdO family nonheme iron enzyme, partial [Xanthobacteraceae bacterium]